MRHMPHKPKVNKVVISVIVSLVIIALLIHTGPVSAVSTEGLIVYFPFNGNANDESFNNNDGTVNGATLTTDRDSNPDSAYNFVASSSQDITLGDINSVFTDKTRMSLSVWFYRGASGTVQFISFFNG